MKINNNMKEINLNEMEKAAGGIILDDISCGLKGHKYTLLEDLLTQEFQYSHFKCKRCGKHRYCKLEHSTGKQTDISRKEYDAVCD